MGLASYAIIPQGKGWGILHDGNVEGDYANKQSAYESAVSAGSAAIREGHELKITVPGDDAGVGNAMGNADHGTDTATT